MDLMRKIYHTVDKMKQKIWNKIKQKIWKKTFE